jgi:hypothetical protein
LSVERYRDMKSKMSRDRGRCQRTFRRVQKDCDNCGLIDCSLRIERPEYESQITLDAFIGSR